MGAFWHLVIVNVTTSSQLRQFQFQYVAPVKSEYSTFQKSLLAQEKNNYQPKTENITRNVLLSAQMGERASVVLICIITSRYNQVK